MNTSNVLLACLFCLAVNPIFGDEDANKVKVNAIVCYHWKMYVMLSTQNNPKSPIHFKRESKVDFIHNNTRMNINGTSLGYINVEQIITITFYEWQR